MNTLDPTIAALADAANVWLWGTAEIIGAVHIALAAGMTLPQFLAQCLLIEQANACGYLATASRVRAVKHAAYTSGAVRAPKRQTRAQRVAAEDRRWGLRP
jgi:hypothetical protein